MIAEVIVGPRNTEPDCECHQTFESRRIDSRDECYYHTEQCEDSIDLCNMMDSLIVRLWNGKYLRIMCLHSSPRDYNGAAVWVKPTLDEILAVNIDSPQVR